MSRHLYLALVLFLFSIHPRLAFGGESSFTVFPLCTTDGQNKSERLEHFHEFMGELGEKLELKTIRRIPQTSNISSCEASLRRSLAALYNFEGFLQGQYLITGDSVSISMQFVNTQYVDRTKELNKVEGNIHNFSDILLKMAMNALNAMAVKPDTFQSIRISQYILEEEGKYTVPVSNTTKANLQLGQLAYSMGNYDKAAEALISIEPGDLNYAEAQFTLGKCVLIANDYHQALLFFNHAKSSGLKSTELNDFIYQAEHLNKPAIWFDSEKKRKNWWLNLTATEAELMLQIMSNLKINGQKFKQGYEFRDADIKALFESDAISLEGCKIADLEYIKCFTKVSFLILDNCKLESGNGINHLNHLKIIKSDKENVLKLPQIEVFVANNNIKLLGK